MICAQKFIGSGLLFDSVCFVKKISFVSLTKFYWALIRIHFHIFGAEKKLVKIQFLHEIKHEINLT